VGKIFNICLFDNHILAGENAKFDLQLSDKISTVTWLKDNKPLDDRMADRINKKQGDGNTFELEVKHCRESDSGLYTARAINGTETSTCSAQLVCETCKFKSILLLSPYFLNDLFL
jgi:hypothetical protein